MHFSADDVPPPHAVMTDSYGKRSSVPHNEALFLLVAIHSRTLAFELPGGETACEFSEFVDTGAACTVSESFD
jgi:hypothetical protein